MKATVLLRKQRRGVERLLARLAWDKPLRLTLVLQLIEELLAHLSVEDHLFLCSISDTMDLPVGTYQAELAAIRNAMLQTVFAEGDDEAFADRLGELVKLFVRHAGRLERELLPVVEAALALDQLETLGARMQRFWESAVPRAAQIASSDAHFAQP